MSKLIPIGDRCVDYVDPEEVTSVQKEGAEVLVTLKRGGALWVTGDVDEIAQWINEARDASRPPR